MRWLGVGESSPAIGGEVPTLERFEVNQALCGDAKFLDVLFADRELLIKFVGDLPITADGEPVLVSTVLPVFRAQYYLRA